LNLTGELLIGEVWVMNSLL